jgi:hypothetical protein
LELKWAKEFLKETVHIALKALGWKNIVAFERKVA